MRAGGKEGSVRGLVYRARVLVAPKRDGRKIAKVRRKWEKERKKESTKERKKGRPRK
jgi:hypothetical protein